MSTATLPRNRTATAILVDLYLRLSDFRLEDEEIDSFPAREARLRERARQLGWEVRKVVTENDLVTGGKRSASAFKRRKIRLPDGRVEMRVVRPGFRAILDDLAAGVIQGVIAEDLDRVCRDPRDLEDLLDVMEQCRGYADSLSGSLKLTAGGNDAEITMARFMVTIANKSSRDTRRRVADARARTAAAGKNGGGRRAYGFLPDGITVDPAEAEEIRNAVDKLLAGVSLAAIARDLDDRAVPTVTGCRWTAEGLRDVLLKPRNAGQIVHTDPKTGKTSVAARLPGEPILPKDTWQAVVDKLTDPRRRTNAGRSPRWLGSGTYLCTCGETLEIQPGTRRAPAYRCSSARPGKVRAPIRHVRRDAEILDRYVSSVVVEVLSKPGAAELVVAAPEGVDVNALRAEVKTLRERKATLARVFASGAIDEEDLKAGTAEIRDRLAVLEQELQAQVGRSPLTPLIEADDVAAAWQALSLGEKRAVVRDLMTVTVLPSRKGSGFDPMAVRIEPRAA